MLLFLTELSHLYKEYTFGSITTVRIMRASLPVIVFLALHVSAGVIRPSSGVKNALVLRRRKTGKRAHHSTASEPERQQYQTHQHAQTSFQSAALSTKAFLHPKSLHVAPQWATRSTIFLMN